MDTRIDFRFNRETRNTMVTLQKAIASGALVLVSCSPAVAQAPSATADQIRLRQQITTMEAVLQQAINIGAQNVAAQVRNIIGDRPRLGAPPRASGFRLDAYGVVFYVQVPDFTLPFLYDVLVREARDKQAAMVLQQWKNQVSGMPPGPQRDREQNAIYRYEQNLREGNYRALDANRGPVTAASLVPAGVEPTRPTVDPSVVDDPESAYTREVKDALIDAMLTNSQGLGIGADERLTVVARDSVPNNPQFPADAIDSPAWIMSVKGSVLAAFRAGTLSREEARKQVEVKEQ
jgi:hypothetical protein